MQPISARVVHDENVFSGSGQRAVSCFDLRCSDRLQDRRVQPPGESQPSQGRRVNNRCQKLTEPTLEQGLGDGVSGGVFGSAYGATVGISQLGDLVAGITWNNTLIYITYATQVLIRDCF